MLRSSTWTSRTSLAAMIVVAALPINAQNTAATSSVGTSSTAFVSTTVTIPATPSSTPTVAPYLASCPAELELQIGICLDTVARDGAVLPCNAEDWWCNCNNWQGIISCYQPCPNLQDQLDIDWNQQNCQGQNGYANFYGGNATDTYVGSNITTTGSNGYTRSYYSEMPKTASATATSTWTWAPAATGSSQQRSTSSASQHYTVPAGLLAISLVVAGAANMFLS